MTPPAADPLAWAVLLPLAYGLLGTAFGARVARAAAPFTLAAMVVVAGLLVADVLADGTRRLAVGGWAPPLGIALRADGLAAALVAMTAAVALAVGIYAGRYFDPADRGARFFWPMLGFLLASMNALFLSDDLFNLYVALELMGLAAVGLVAIEGSVVALAAAVRYLLAALLGSLAYLMGVALLYGAHGTLALPEVGAALGPGAVSTAALALMTVGLVLKTALFPLHFWLPQAHGGAATPVSALLSAVVVKGSFYVLLRLWFDVFDDVATVAAANLLGVLGAAAIAWGSLLALRQQRLKMVVAYSTVAQVGYLFLLFPLATDPSTADGAWRGGVYQAISHGFAKAAMFLAAGAMIAGSASDRIPALAGVSHRVPIGLFAFALAAVSLMGLPPSGGFIAKWLMLQASIASGQWWWAVVLVGGGFLSAAYLFRVMRWSFVEDDPQSGDGHGGAHGRPATPLRIAATRPLELGALSLALVALALGLAPDAPLALLGIGAPFGAAP
jgi:multicomponent Na+:H+ antiporter subunit D